LGPPNGGDVRFPGAGSSALAELTGGDFQEGVVRLEYTPPAIGGRRERARIRGTQLRLQQSRAFLQEAERLLVSQLGGAVARTASHYRLTQTHAQRWQAAEREVEARLAEFKGGRSPVNVVLQSQQRRADAMIDYYRALTEYNKSINYVDYLKGTMLANSNITLSEGPWNKKAYWDALERARERSAGKKGQYGVSRPNVVRQGPVRNPESVAAGITGDRIGGHSQALPADGIILDSPLPIEVDDTPLGEMGNNPAEVFGQGSDIQLRPAPYPNVELPTVPDEISTPIPTPDPFPNAAFDQIAPMNYQAEVNISGAPAPVSRKPIPIR